MKDTPSIPLIILDVQDAIDQPVWNGKSHPGYLSVIQRLLRHWRSNGWPVLHVKHDEENPTSSYHVHGPWNGIKKEVAPVEGEIVIIKRENCAFIGTQLDAILKSMQVKRIVLTGVVVQNSMDATLIQSSRCKPDSHAVVHQDFHSVSPAIGEQVSAVRLRRTKHRDHTG